MTLQDIGNTRVFHFMCNFIGTAVATGSVALLGWIAYHTAENNEQLSSVGSTLDTVAERQQEQVEEVDENTVLIQENMKKIERHGVQIDSHQYWLEKLSDEEEAP